MERGVQEHYWTNSAQGRNKGVVYQPYTEVIDGERLFQCLICLCVIYFVARLFFDGIVVFLIVGLTVGLIMQLLNACGHIFCFWCAYLSVNPETKSRCPRCRLPFLHIPRVCKMLHLLLQRVEPEEYKMRTEDWEEMETLRGTFSPSLDVESGPSDAFMEYLRNWYASSNESMGMTRPSTEFFDENGIHTPRSPKLTPSSFLLGNQQEEDQVQEILGQDIGDSSSPLEYDLKSEALDIEATSKGSWDSTYVDLVGSFKNENLLPESLDLIAENDSTWNEVDDQLTTGSGGQFEDTSEQSELDELDIMVDLLCPRCDNLLYRPIVLNCGDVFCERCIGVPRGAILKCPFCKRHQPGLLSQVCDELDAYLINAFPLEYNVQANRMPARKQKPVHRFGDLPTEVKKALDISTWRRQRLVAINTALVCDWFPGAARKYPRRIVENIGPKLRGPLHYGIVCDGCGMVPIMGPRFECLDCTKEFGFDLCETCHYQGFDLTGHVNQEHTSDHRMQIWNRWRRKGVQRYQISQQGRGCPAPHCVREEEMEQDEVWQV